MFVDAVITKVSTSEEQNGTAVVCFQDGLAAKLLWKSYSKVLCLGSCGFSRRSCSVTITSAPLSEERKQLN